MLGLLLLCTVKPPEICKQIKLINHVVNSDNQHLHLHHHVQVCWLIRSLKNLAKDGATPSLLLKTQSLPCRSKWMWTMTLAGSAPGEKLVAIYTCCRYGPDWAQSRGISRLALAGNEETLDPGLDANLKITSVTGISGNNSGNTRMLKAQLSEYGSSWGPLGDSRLGGGRSERPSPSSPPMVLSHLSGDTTSNARILRFHWRPQ